MQFTAQPKSKRDYFFSQPHQPFFTLGIIDAILFMLLFIPAFRGLIATDALYLHAFSMIFLVFTNFFYGFLYTTFPRFSGTEPIAPRQYLVVVLLQALAAVTFLVGIWWQPGLYAAALFVAAGFGKTLQVFYRIYQRCTLPKRDQYWIIVALGIGAMSDILFLLSLVPCKCATNVFFATAVGFGVYMYMFFLAFVVGFRMVPFFSHVMGYVVPKWLHIAILTLFTLHSFFSVAFPEALFVMDALAGALIVRELIRMRLPFPNSEPLLWILHLALFWLGGGLLLGAIVEAFEAFGGWSSLHLPLHLLALGFLTTVLIGFGTRVTLGHSGNMLRVGRATVWIFYFTQVVLLGRIVLSLAAAFGHISPYFDISAALWIALFVWWMAKYFKVLAFGAKIA